MLKQPDAIRQPLHKFPVFRNLPNPWRRPDPV
jgi:hypothetical protein